MGNSPVLKNDISEEAHVRGRKQDSQSREYENRGKKKIIDQLKSN